MLAAATSMTIGSRRRDVVATVRGGVNDVYLERAVKKKKILDDKRPLPFAISENLTPMTKDNSNPAFLSVVALRKKENNVAQKKGSSDKSSFLGKTFVCFFRRLVKRS